MTMLKKGKSLLLFGILFLIVSTSILISAVDPIDSNLFASISNPKMVLYENLTSDSLEIKNSVIVNNKNDFPVTITLVGMGAWEENIVFEELEFLLEPDERKEAFYTIVVDTPGEHGGDIQVSFRAEGNPNTLSVLQRVVVQVKDDRPADLRKVIGLAITLVLLAILVTLYFKIKTKRKNKK
jgi:hypothetical protein